MNSQTLTNNFPKLHNAMWPGLVGKGSPGAEPCIDLDTMLDLTARAEVNGTRFDGVDLFLFDPHLSIDSDATAVKKLADKIASRGLRVGSVVAPVWPPTGGGSAMGSDEDRQKFIGQVRKACRIARQLRDLGVRPSGVVRIDSACGVADWAADPAANQQKIITTFADACKVAEEFGERLAAEGEICWGGMHSWKHMLEILEGVNRPETLGFQADMAHTLLYVLGYNAPEDGILPPDWDWSDGAKLDDALRQLTDALRPWTIDFHVAQNDATVHGSGTHDKTGHHCLPNDPNGKLDIARHAGYWLRDENGKPARKIRHICWDGCMFKNEVMMRQETWNDVLAAMVAVREAHGWREEAPEEKAAERPPTVIKTKRARIAKRPIPKTKPAKRKAAVHPRPTAKRKSVRKPVRQVRAAKAKRAKTPVRAKRISAKAVFKKKSQKAKAARKGGSRSKR